MLAKYKDPGCPTIACSIGNIRIDHALLDLGASVNLLSYTVYKQLGLGELKPTIVTLQLADRSVKTPKWMVEDVLVKVSDFLFPVDFIVLDTQPVAHVKDQIPIILGRPFLATSNALINCRNGLMKLSSGFEECLEQLGDTGGDFFAEAFSLQHKMDPVGPLSKSLPKPSIEEPPQLDLKPLPSNLRIAKEGDVHDSKSRYGTHPKIIPPFLPVKQYIQRKLRNNFEERGKQNTPLSLSHQPFFTFFRFQDLAIQQKYLITFTVGYDQKNNIDAAVKKFSENFTILLFHYDGLTSEWDDFEWSKRAIHVSAMKQTKWWYAKRFLHPDIVAQYEYIFIWDEDLGVEHFNAEEYIKLVKKHGLEISQPALDPNRGFTWQMTKRRGDHEVHKETEDRPGWCSDPHLPPCAAYELNYLCFASPF
ncbi:uncharacterized protein LOC143891108 [Tasmannia lanceolata]|uniref:uncharacterized protein LOC143891108 n=1 Tax=Tasmannia lanceolata TaxID=3420 RepID=UPI004063D516